MKIAEIIEQSRPALSVLESNKITIKMLRHMHMYGEFMSLADIHRRMRIYRQLAERYSLHPRTVQRIICKLNREIPEK